MPSEPHQLPHDINALRALVAEQAARNAELEQRADPQKPGVTRAAGPHHRVQVPGCPAAVPPATATGKALQYLHSEWGKLVVYLEDGWLEIDNNVAEHAIRRLALGRKNRLFSNPVAGVNVSANPYALIETAKANGLEPYADLRHVYTRLPQAVTVDEMEALLHGNITPEQIA